MSHWEQQLERLARRMTQLVWWIFDLAALLTIVALPHDGLIACAEAASQLLLIACALLLWRETTKAVVA